MPVWRLKPAVVSSSRDAPRAARASRRNTAPTGSFARDARLTRPAEFDRVFSEGRRRRLKHFTLVFAPAASRPRLGMSVGRRASPRAVVRNRIKRIVRESFRQAKLPAVDVVVVAHPNIGHVERRTMRVELDAGFGAIS